MGCLTGFTRHRWHDLIHKNQIVVIHRLAFNFVHRFFAVCAEFTLDAWMGKTSQRKGVRGCMCCGGDSIGRVVHIDDVTKGKAYVEKGEYKGSNEGKCVSTCMYIKRV